MKPFEDLTRLGRLRRMRQVAETALEEYDLAVTRVHFLKHAGNTMFRVVEAKPGHAGETGGLFVDGQYLLRIHQPGFQTADAIAVELAWLAALRRDAGAPVPEPVLTRKGRLLTAVALPGVPGTLDCSLLKWVKGRMATRGIWPDHYRAQGRLMAVLHGHAARWGPPGSSARRHYDWNGLFRDDGGSGMPASEAWALLPAAHVEPFEEVARRVKEATEALGDGPEVSGMIHADLGVDANVLFWKGEARAIDFDDSGIGYWVYDLAIALEHCREDAAYSLYRDALLEGYAERRSLPNEQTEHLELFLAAFQVYWSLWAVAMAHRRPEHQEVLFKRMKRAARLVRRYLAGSA